jgi:transposase
MVAEVRQRATREQLGRRGTSRDPIWVNRRLLLTGVSTCPASKRSGYGGLSTSVTPPRKFRPRGRSKNGSAAAQTTRTVQDPSRLADFYEAVIDAQLPEATQLARTVETWWSVILIALTHDVSNARTEGFNRVIKQTKRVGCGFRSQLNYQRRILSHIAVTRPQKSAA